MKFKVGPSLNGQMLNVMIYLSNMMAMSDTHTISDISSDNPKKGDND